MKHGTTHKVTLQLGHHYVDSLRILFTQPSLHLRVTLVFDVEQGIQSGKCLSMKRVASRIINGREDEVDFVDLYEGVYCNSFFNTFN